MVILASTLTALDQLNRLGALTRNRSGSIGVLAFGPTSHFLRSIRMKLFSSIGITESNNDGFRQSDEEATIADRR
jgi:hypothetical protein